MVKPSPVQAIRSFRIDDAQADLRGMPLKSLIALAWRLEPDALTAPSWTDTTLFDLSAKLPSGARKDEFPDMLRTLLESRFQLQAHREALDQQVLTLAVVKDGPKLAPAAPDNGIDSEWMKGRVVLQKIETPSGDGVWTVSIATADANHRRVLDAPRITMEELAGILKPYAERTVVDRTELKGWWHVTLEVPQPARAGRAGGDPVGGVSLYRSLEQAGLKLEKQTAPVDRLIVDRVLKLPTDN